MHSALAQKPGRCKQKRGATEIRSPGPLVAPCPAPWPPRGMEGHGHREGDFCRFGPFLEGRKASWRKGWCAKPTTPLTTARSADGSGLFGRVFLNADFSACSVRIPSKSLLSTNVRVFLTSARRFYSWSKRNRTFPYFSPRQPGRWSQIPTNRTTVSVKASSLKRPSDSTLATSTPNTQDPISLASWQTFWRVSSLHLETA